MFHKNGCEVNNGADRDIFMEYEPNDEEKQKIVIMLKRVKKNLTRVNSRQP